MDCVKVTASVRKPKKKAVKDELDRIKQAEKKKRRLEKALATSAAIISELEKKKLKQKEEQKRLDEEGATIAEAVALQVLLGEDLDDSEKKDEGLTSWDHASNISFITGSRHPHFNNLSKSPCENVASMIPSSSQFGRIWGHSNVLGFEKGCVPQHFGDIWGSVGLSTGHLAAQAVSSLKIAENSGVHTFVANRFVRG